MPFWGENSGAVTAAKAVFTRHRSSSNAPSSKGSKRSGISQALSSATSRAGNRLTSWGVTPWRDIKVSDTFDEFHRPKLDSLDDEFRNQIILREGTWTNPKTKRLETYRDTNTGFGTEEFRSGKKNGGIPGYLENGSTTSFQDQAELQIKAAYGGLNHRKWLDEKFTKKAKEHYQKIRKETLQPARKELLRQKGAMEQLTAQQEKRRQQIIALGDKQQALVGKLPANMQGEFLPAAPVLTPASIGQQQLPLRKSPTQLDPPIVPLTKGSTSYMGGNIQDWAKGMGTNETA